jgi:ribosomal-protein-alanine N-acetyltransferase
MKEQVNTNIKFNILRPSDPVADTELEAIAQFLFTHLGQYGDRKEDILKCLHYALGRTGQGGFILVSTDNQHIIGAVVINRTGMEGYIPENILVYIAVHEESRGSGLGKKMMQEVIEKAEGGIALHVEPDNPARRLYERLGFTSKYLEMRLTE